MWESKSVKQPNLTVWLKKGGSELSSGQPFLRIEATFPKAVKMHTLVKTLYDYDVLLSYDQNLVRCDGLPLENKCRSASFVYSRHKR